MLLPRSRSAPLAGREIPVSVLVREGFGEVLRLDHGARDFQEDEIRQCAHIPRICGALAELNFLSAKEAARTLSI